MRAPYRPFPTPNGKTDYYPLVRGCIAKKHGPKTRQFEVLVDSGASDCIFHADTARSIGINLESGRKEIRNGIGGSQEIWIHTIQLYIGAEMLSIEAGFAKTLPVAGLLGRKGFFENFKITFDPSSLPPGMEIERVHIA